MMKLLSVLLTINLVLFICGNVMPQDVYVSPTGNDSNNGTSQSTPVRTFQKGADIAKSLGSSGIIVEFADGEYVFENTVILDATYSGILFQAAAGAYPVFSSLIQITDWTVYNGDIMIANLPLGVNNICYLQDRSENWLERSATESFSTTELAGGDDDGCIECNTYTESTQPDMSNIRYPSSYLTPDWTYASQYYLRANTLPWHLDLLPISYVDEGENRIYTSVPGLYDLRKHAEDDVFPTAWILNSIDGIDTPGEWACIDQQIYLLPLSGTNDIYIPTLTELIRLDDGTLNGNDAITDPVTDITFDGITFTGCDFRTMQSDDVTTQHDWMVVDEADALLRIRNSSGITVQNCTFEKSGGTGLRIDRFAQNHLIYNNTFHHLGKGGINVAGRGPGYGDVSMNNEISYNILEYTGKEKWASIAILLDNSSNNYVHHNYIANVYFTGLASIGPRQLMLAAWNEGADAFYVGREFQFWEVKPSVVTFIANNGGTLIGSQEAMRFVYNYNNRIEENLFIDVSKGKGMLINGRIYVSGAQRSLSVNDIKTNFVERNYFYDSYNHSVNDYVLYSDSDQDACDYIGNMILDIKNGDSQPGPMPIILAFNQWAESGTLGMGQITLKANVTENSTFCDEPECHHTIGIDYIEEGEIINGIGGSAQYISIYEEMYFAICDENFPQINTIPGAQAMRDRLISTIELLGGTAPDCGVLADDEIKDQSNLFSIFPNPAENTLFIRNETRKSIISVDIINITGQQVKSIKDVREVSSVDISNLAPGFYLIQMYSDNMMFVSRFIKK